MKFDSITTALALYLATGIGASYVPKESTPFSYGMVKSYNGEWQTIKIDVNGKVQHPDSLPEWFKHQKFPNQGQKPDTSCSSTSPPQLPPTNKPEGEKPGDKAPPSEKPEIQYPSTDKPENQSPSNQKPGDKNPSTEKPVNQYPEGSEKPRSGNPAKGTCANISTDPGMDLQKMLKLVNEARKGLEPLKLNEALIKGAIWQSQNQQKLNRVGHKGIEGTDGVDVGSRMMQCGLTGVSLVAENAAPGTTEEGVMKMWMESSYHRKNIMNPKIKEFGAARAGNFWTQTFAGSYF
ncbi:hypothetical protein CONCODRAFT_70336 [Conidiobolus coronatus NRRL 28638]|uniref:SCP domain-containing protein n=1 Tax=Conidiobolus coronatus (strain ATCC 28846 / CBS 209.66 / NRRL 28638) TaxID=796925 RepID=A0A137P761_CONC2|nr:hypothetical protein CONCODRAFT_70336 [Conidiobolus coronatus NRRL 28638]|eukprot:KXN70857.1 hypothetical protein CONCODRAFT_70336 [Conidiobolus coronatus NRRL 28638]